MVALNEAAVSEKLEKISAEEFWQNIKTGDFLISSGVARGFMEKITTEKKTIILSIKMPSDLVNHAMGLSPIKQF
jgi:hypothetical protein